MPEIEQLLRQIESSWISSGAWPELIAAMRLALISDTGGKSRWLQLPGYCCQAAGGNTELAIDLTAAWLLYYAAAHLMDSVQDQDEPDPWWANRGAGTALSAATGLYFSAGLVLNQLHKYPVSSGAAADIADSFFKGFMILCSGQLRDIEQPALDLEDYWTSADSRSGMFFALACRNGARLATADSQRLESFFEFGKHLGIIIQILDDLDDVVKAADDPSPLIPSQMQHSLPYVYALSVLPLAEAKKLQTCARNQGGEGGKAEALELIDLSGAAMYTLAVVEERKRLALQSLAETDAEPEASRLLTGLIESL